MGAPPQGRRGKQSDRGLSRGEQSRDLLKGLPPFPRRAQPPPASLKNRVARRAAPQLKSWFRSTPKPPGFQLRRAANSKRSTWVCRLTVDVVPTFVCWFLRDDSEGTLPSSLQHRANGPDQSLVVEVRPLTPPESASREVTHDALVGFRVDADRQAVGRRWNASHSL